MSRRVPGATRPPSPGSHRTAEHTCSCPEPGQLAIFPPTPTCHWLKVAGAKLMLTARERPLGTWNQIHGDSDCQ